MQIIRLRYHMLQVPKTVITPEVYEAANLSMLSPERSPAPSFRKGSSIRSLGLPDEIDLDAVEVLCNLRFGCSGRWLCAAAGCFSFWFPVFVASRLRCMRSGIYTRYIYCSNRVG